MPDSPDPPGWVRPLLEGDLAGGVPRDLVLWPDSRLRRRCESSAFLGAAALRRLAADMLATMYAAGGRGLAAPQVGVLFRVFVMDAGWKDGRPDPLVMLDPEILWRSSRRDSGDEKCLSIPDRVVAVSRPSTIDLGWYDLDGRHHLRQMSGPEARIAQHEADHLDGRLILED
ncbi:peptide deformylase [Paracoccus sp. T5]|uniref:peptide deformylase n=1 Tax=Paracoccus sp. T5 TaxID=3402161 RepID=UPI003ADB8837